MTARAPWRLINTPELEAIPAALARARGNHTARALATAQWLIRRKAGGRYLAVAQRTNDGWRLERLAPARPDSDADLAALAACLSRHEPAPGILPIGRLPALLTALGIPDSYGSDHALPLMPEPTELAFAGLDRYRRALWLTQPAARAWLRMQRAALADGVTLEAISGYRSHAYQLGIFRRKLARGQSVEQILNVNAAPGYSEHHSGRALDIGAPGEPAAEESFEATPAFAWLRQHAEAFGFELSYPRDNPHGIVYEPWHWCWREASAHSRTEHPPPLSS